LRPTVEPEARLCRLNAAARAVEKLLAEPLLEGANLQADCRLRHAKLISGLREAPALDHRAKGSELLRVHKHNL
jgi:hypothetical protein